MCSYIHDASQAMFLSCSVCNSTRQGIQADTRLTPFSSSMEPTPLSPVQWPSSSGMAPTGGSPWSYSGSSSGSLSGSQAGSQPGSQAGSQSGSPFGSHAGMRALSKISTPVGSVGKNRAEIETGLRSSSQQVSLAPSWCTTSNPSIKPRVTNEELSLYRLKNRPHVDEGEQDSRKLSNRCPDGRSYRTGNYVSMTEMRDLFERATIPDGIKVRKYHCRSMSASGSVCRGILPRHVRHHPLDTNLYFDRHSMHLYNGLPSDSLCYLVPHDEFCALDPSAVTSFADSVHVLEAAASGLR